MKVSRGRFTLATLFLILLTASTVLAQQTPEPKQTTPAPQKAEGAAKKINERPAAQPTPAPEPFDGASVEKMTAQCVRLETEAGAIEIEMLPESAPESVRNFLNLAATSLFDTTTFSRVVKGFVVQGGNLSTGQKWNFETAKRAARKIPDEPSLVKHERGIVSMARPDEPNSATTHFFILVGEAAQLDGKFSAFGRVTAGMDVVDAINQAEAENEKPAKPVVLTRALVRECHAAGAK